MDLCLEGWGVGSFLKSRLRNDVPSFQLNDFLMNSALLLEVQKGLSQVKMEIERNSLPGMAQELGEL